MFSSDVADKIYSMWKKRFSMKEISDIKSNNYVGKNYSNVCYSFKNTIMRLDYWGNMYIIECADSFEHAKIMIMKMCIHMMLAIIQYQNW